MSNKKYWRWGVGGLLILTVIITLTFIFNHNAEKGEESWTNITELSQEFLDNYFTETAELAENYDAENILLVTSKSYPKTYSAAKVVEAPNYLYILQYEDAEMRDVAFDNLENDGVIVEKNFKQELMGSYLSWGIEDMELDKLSAQVAASADKKDVVVAVIDSGMDTAKWKRYFSEDRLMTYCVVECADGMEDTQRYQHGTHVSGTVAEGTPDNVKILAIRVSNDADGSMSSLDVDTAINYAVTQGVDVINMSLGGYTPSPAQKNALDAAAAAGIINVAAAGNENTNAPAYPASFDSVISVAAINEDWDRWDDGDEGGSNYGEYVEFAAPGDSVGGINGYYMTGTSMATPHIAAVTANFKSINKTIVLDDARALMKTYAADLGETGWDQYYGWGLPYFYEVELCGGVNCDEYGIFKSPHTVRNLTGGEAWYFARADYINVAADKACMVIAANEDAETYTRITAVAGDDVYAFDLSVVSSDDEIILALVGDVTMDGKVNVLDLAKVKRSILLPTNKNYAALTNLQKVIADVNKDGKVNILDLAKIKRATLLTTNKNYAQLNW